MSLEMEFSLLSALCMDSSQLPTLDLQESDFSTEATAAIFKQVEKWTNHGVQPDIALVWEGVQTHGDAGLFNGIQDVGEALTSPCSVRNINAYCRAVKLAAKHGAIERLAGHIYDAIGSETDDMQARIDSVRDAMADFEAQLQVVREASDMHDVMVEAYEDLVRLWQSDGGLCGITTGLQRLDNITHGMQDGHLIIVAGRPSMGKTLLGQQLAVAAASKGKKVEFITLEMSAAEIGQRMISAVSEVPLAELRNGQFSKKGAAEAIDGAVTYLKKLSIKISDDSNTLGKICSRARRAKLKGGLDILIIDQLSAMPTKGNNRALELKAITGGLKQLAKELQVPVVLLHQIGRAAVAKVDKRPDISDLKDSGAVEEDADVVLLLHRESYYNPQANPTECEIILGKYRSGQRGAVAKVGTKLETCKFTHEPDQWADVCNVPNAKSENAWI